MDAYKIKHIYFFLLVFLYTATAIVVAQHAQASFRLLNMPENARQAGMADLAIVQWDKTIQAGAVHPALLRPEMSKQWYFNYSSQGQAFNQHGTFVAYALKNAIMGFGLRSIQARQIKGMDEFGNYTGTYNVGEYQFKAYYNRFIADSIFSIGIGTALNWNQFETYRACASTINWAVMAHLNASTHVALCLKNMGWYWYSTYSTTRLPFTSQIGISHKLSKAPFRVMLVYEGLETFNRSVPKSNTTSNTSFNSIPTDSTDWQKFSVRSGQWLTKFSNHVQLGTEIIFSEQFKLSFGYAFRRAQEESLERAFSTTGLHFGFMLQTRRFGFSYGFQNLSVPLGGHYFTCSIPLKTLRKVHK